MKSKLEGQQPATSTSRLFYAMPSCHEILEASEKLRIQNQELDGTRWIPGANHHITLYFLGEVDVIHIPEFTGIMNRILELTPDFELQFNKFSLEGGRSEHPSMLWAKFEKHPSFTELSHNIGKLVSPYISTVSKFSEPIPHVTLARIRSGPLPGIELELSCSIRFHGLELWKTIRGRTGVSYEALYKKYRE